MWEPFTALDSSLSAYRDFHLRVSSAGHQGQRQSWQYPLKQLSLVLPGVEEELHTVVVNGHDEPEVGQLRIPQTRITDGGCVIHVFITHIPLEPCWKHLHHETLLQHISNENVLRNDTHKWSYTKTIIYRNKNLNQQSQWQMSVWTVRKNLQSLWILF